MPKKTKTRKQKITADAKQHVQQTQEQTKTIASPTYSINVEKHTVAHPKMASIHPTTAVEYSYLSKELRKTVSVTVAIILAEIVLYTLTKGVL